MTWQARQSAAAGIPAAFRPPVPLLSGSDLQELRAGYQDLLPLAPGLEPHLRGVLADTLGHPGGLVRAQLTYGLMKRYGQDAEASRGVAMAVEYFHTASLLLDDLPSMDDATQRRGHPCPHVVHGEGATVLGALALITRAYALLWEGIAVLPLARRRKAAAKVEACLGLGGIIGGQARDLNLAAHPSAKEAQEVAEGKTSSLIQLCLELPALVAGRKEQEQAALRRLGSLWGLLYQGLDDFKDLLAEEKETGKTCGRDALLGRPNLLAGAGAAQAQRELRRLLRGARAEVLALEGDSPGVLSSLQALLDAEARKLWGRLAPANAPSAPSKRLRQGSLDFAERALMSTLDPQARLILAVPAPQVDGETFVQAAGNDATFFWDGGDGGVWAGSGVAHRLEAQGPARFLSLQAQAARLSRTLDLRSHPDVMARPPRYFGGLSFVPGSASDPPWQDFGDGAFVLPRALYRVESGAKEGATATLSLALEPGEATTRKGRHEVLGELEARLDELQRCGRQGAAESEDFPGLLGVDVLPWGQWRQAVEEITRGIAADEYVKVVAARRSHARLSSPLPLASSLRRLRSAVGCIRFAFQENGTFFLGATPERLVTVANREVTTEALAGTVPRGEDVSLEHFSSAKLLLEHEVVAAEIRRRLGPFCDRLDRLPPTVRRLRGLVHLKTPLQGYLSRRRHVLELAAALHPTPAVGGVPTAAALAWIRSREAFARGWYASPVGWFDTHGDGELAVALRCALVKDDAAFLYAGAGIVAGSDAAEEWEELALKERAVLSVLGAAEER